ncbi:MAG: hypothetical protein SFV52_13870 [Saprospiraceae bacterium]|nr:hypothetical protein [Saprospiraceae bacterium]
MKNTWIKWSKWEFWPARVANLPVYGMGVWLALRAGDPLFFTNLNPGIPLSGAVGESKLAILRLLPSRLVPPTIAVESGMTIEACLDRMREAGIAFPVVAKPDVGERGFLVRICRDESELENHLRHHPTLFLVQPFIPLPEEYALFFYRFPDGGAFGIHSVCKKGFLQVTGDGRSTVGELMTGSFRASLQAARIARDNPELYRKVPANGEQVVLEPIGNHIRGTTFYDARNVVDQAMLDTYRRIADEMPNITFGRFDLKCASADALRKGDVQVVEMNGVFGEPAHVYDPGFSVAQVYAEFWKHWLLIYRLHKAQKAAGVRTATLTEARTILRNWRAHKKRLQRLTQ